MVLDGVCCLGLDIAGFVHGGKGDSRGDKEWENKVCNFIRGDLPMAVQIN